MRTIRASVLTALTMATVAGCATSISGSADSTERSIRSLLLIARSLRLSSSARLRSVRSKTVVG